MCVTRALFIMNIGKSVTNDTVVLTTLERGVSAFQGMVDVSPMAWNVVKGGNVLVHDSVMKGELHQAQAFY